MVERTETSKTPEKYVRIQITKTTKGYQAETTISLRWPGTFGSDALANGTMADLLADADELARVEIERRERMDRLDAEGQAA